MSTKEENNSMESRVDGGKDQLEEKQEERTGTSEEVEETVNKIF